MFTKKSGKSSPSFLVPYRNRSDVVDLVGREPLIIARVENGVTKFYPKRQKTTIFQRKIGSGTAVFSGEFSFFWPREN